MNIDQAIRSQAVDHAKRNLVDTINQFREDDPQLDEIMTRLEHSRCSHVGIGCNYPEGEGLGFCLTRGTK